MDGWTYVVEKNSLKVGLYRGRRIKEGKEF